jgi:basic membrane lipoprotein Med (substrate-binding protein (PBP1-ABC) superfamily)
MFFRNINIILFISLFVVFTPIPNNQLSYSQSGNKSQMNFSIKSNQDIASVSGNFSIIIFNLESYYSSEQILKIENYVFNILKPKYSAAQFNISIIEDTEGQSFIFADFFANLMTELTPSFVLIIGPIYDDQNSFSQTLESYENTKFGFIDYMRSKYETVSSSTQNISFASFDFSQSGFMLGLQSSILTKTNKIGIILDHSLNVDFYNKVSSPKSEGNVQIYDFNRAELIYGFIAGVEYSAENILNRTKIDLKTVAYDFKNPTATATDIMKNNVKTLSDFGADVIFNMESGLDKDFIQEANSLAILTGVIGTNRSDATFSMVLNNEFIINDIINLWNSSNDDFKLKYTLENSSVMSLSDMNDARLLSVQNLILNGTIKIPLEYPSERIFGFDFVVTFLPIACLIFLKKIKN